MERLELARSQDETINDREYLRRRIDILNFKSRACSYLGKLEEQKEIANEIIDLWTGLGTELQVCVHDSLSDHSHVVEPLIKQRRFREAQKVNNDVLNLIDGYQRMAHRNVFLDIYSQKARILSTMRKGSDAEPAVVLADEEERAILRIFREVFDERRALKPITS